MKLLMPLALCAFVLATVVDAADDYQPGTLRKRCDDADQTPPAPTTPTVTTPVPTTLAPTTPGATTPVPSTPAGTTPGPTTPAGTTPSPTTPGSTTPGSTTPGPTTPTPTTPTPTTPAPADKSHEFTRDGIDCAGFLRLPRPGFPLSRTNCVLDYKVQFTADDATAIDGCVVCDGAFVYDRTVPLEQQAMPLCGGLPLCTRLGAYSGLTEYDLMCVLTKNGAAAVEDAAVCGLGDN